MPAKQAKERPVLVTTAHRGVFFGYATATKGETIELKRARNVVYWPPETKGFMGLAANGPHANCRIGPATDIELRNVTAVAEVALEAAKKFGQFVWR